MKHLKTYKIFENQSHDNDDLDIEFIRQPKKNKDSKTDTFNVLKNDILIGQVRWSSRLRGYAFLPSKDCESTVKEFVKDLMMKRRMK